MPREKARSTKTTSFTLLKTLMSLVWCFALYFYPHDKKQTKNDNYGAGHVELLKLIKFIKYFNLNHTVDFFFHFIYIYLLIQEVSMELHRNFINHFIERKFFKNQEIDWLFFLNLGFYKSIVFLVQGLIAAIFLITFFHLWEILPNITGYLMSTQKYFIGHFLNFF